LTVAFETFGVVVEAVMVVFPTPAPVTGTVTDVAFWAMVTDDGIVTMPLAPAVRLTVSGEGAGADRVRVRFWVTGPVIVTEGWLKLRLAATLTVCVPVWKPGAEALIEADPKFTPVTVGWVAGCVCPAAIVTVPGEIVSFVGSLLVSVTVTPPCGAAVGSVTGNAMD